MKRTDQISFSNEKYRKRRECSQEFKARLIGLMERSDRTGRQRVLDIGCGTGVNSARMREMGHEVFGVDISAEAIEKYNAAGMNGIVADIEADALPFEDGFFDAVLMSEVIEHLYSTDAVIKKMGRVLRKGGTLILSTPNSAFFLYRIIQMTGKTCTELQHPCHIRYFSMKSLASILRANGFKLTGRMGNNIFAVLPARIVYSIFRMAGIGESAVNRIMGLLSFKYEAGLIHGDKFMLSFFSEHGISFFSNVLMIKAVKET